MDDFVTDINNIKKILKVKDHKNSISDLQFLDKGGQKTVYKCTIDDEKYVLKFSAIKIDEINGEFDNSESQIISTQLSRIKREIDIMKKIDSPHVVKVGPIGLNTMQYEDKFIIYFSEEFIDGKSLDKLLSQHKQNYLQNIKLAIHITKSIKSLWSINMVHRDIKPQNIMVHKNGHYVLLDAGIAFDVMGEHLTYIPIPIGTMIYTSPEQLQINKQQFDFRTDLFLLGIVLYQFTTGKHPFYEGGDTEDNVKLKIVSEDIKRPSTYIADFPSQLERILIRLLSKQQHLRYRNCNILLDELYNLQEELQ